jgi:hypothetical protein
MTRQFITIILLSITASLSLAAILPTSLNTFGVLAYSTVTNSGATTIGDPALKLDIGLYPGTSVTGFPPGILNGNMEVFTTKAQLALADVGTAYGDIANTPCTTLLADTELGGKTFVPGVYCSAAPITLTGIMYLDSAGKVGPIWIFQFAQTLTTASTSEVVFTKTSAPCNVFWNIGTSATLGSTSIFKGIINAYASISYGTGVAHTGKALAQTGAVTLLGNTIVGCTEQSSGESTCHGIVSTDPKVCSGKKGQCILQDTCVCGSGTGGAQCEKCQTGFTSVAGVCTRTRTSGTGAITLGAVCATLMAVLAL